MKIKKKRFFIKNCGHFDLDCASVGKLTFPKTKNAAFQISY